MWWWWWWWCCCWFLAAFAAGQFLTCGDGEGQLWFWDWRTGKVYRKVRAHKEGPAIDVLWHPHDPSRVVSAGWDGLIKMFE